MLDSDASTAKTLALVAIILQAVFLFIAVIVVLFAAIASLSSVVTTYLSNGTVQTTHVRTVTPFLTVLALVIVIIVILAIGLLWILLDYFLIYKKLKTERVKEAETPAIVLGIIQLIFGGLIPGILLIIAYVKIRDSENRRRSMPEGQQGTPP
ncbi:MAG: hypothetical protein M1556_02615 [Candidatus Thermoplasmatota archaeon]|jgi:hypothetical protein|nr:hypothetical protein [Candidatus Thermoplasmatota archaeon]